MTDYNTIANDETIAKVVEALDSKGFTVETVETLEQAKSSIVKLISEGSEVFTATSKTLDDAGISTLINESGKYDAVRPKLMEMAQKQPEKVTERKQLTAAVDYVLGSAAAITEDGKIMVASATGSQIAPEVYGANHVVFVVSAKKIVKDLDDGVQRIGQHIFPQEDQRVQTAYNNKDIHTHFSKLLVYVKDFENRVHVIIVKEPAGF